MSRHLDVYFRETRAGRLSQEDTGLLSFTYNAGYLAAPDARAISFSMPLQDASYDDRIARPFFSGLLPDEGARQRLAGALGISAGNAFGLLEIIGGECAGGRGGEGKRNEEGPQHGYQSRSFLVGFFGSSSCIN